MNNQSDTHGGLAIRARDLLIQLTNSRDELFACRDQSLRRGNFEAISRLDATARPEDVEGKLDALLKARSAIRLKLRIAERLLSEIEEKATGYETMVYPREGATSKTD
jgi:hypothetical protein